MGTQVSPPDSLETVYGHVDLATTRAIYGWAWLPADPLSRRMLELRVDGHRIGTVVASTFRQDLENAGIGDGFHAFEFHLPDHESHLGAPARVLDLETGVELTGSPMTLRADAAAPSDNVATDAEAPPDTSPRTHLDRQAPAASISADSESLAGEILWADVMSIGGWALNPARPDQVLRVRARIDGRAAGEAIADHQLSRNPEPGISNHGFRIPLDNKQLLADGMNVEVVAEDAANECTLVMQGTIHTEAYGEIDRCDDRLVRGWCINWNDPTTKLVVDVFVNDEYIGQALADRPRDDLRRLGLDDRLCGYLYQFVPAIDMKLSRDVAIRVLIRGTAIELNNSPWWIGRSVRLSNKPDGAGSP